MLPLVTVKGVDTQGGDPNPVSLGSVTFPSRPVSPVLFMFADTAKAAGATTTGLSLTGLTVIVKVWSAELSTPGVVPPVS